ncbi:hypothetical protein FRC08_009354 [Ceratobasidium sp. 394]|nr:hypothetical protein FRC08_009354 [Ceratobasidium sp. 394]
MSFALNLTPFPQSDIPDPLPKHYFDRFGLYASFVKYLEFRVAGYTHTRRQGLGAIRSYVQAAHVLLPNLVSLSSKSAHVYPWRNLTDETLDWLEVLMSPSLEQLDLIDTDNIFTDESLESLYTPIITSINKCSNLVDLSFCYGSTAGAGSQTFTSIAATALHTTVPTNLVNLRCRSAPLCLEFFNWLASMAKLQRLQLEWPKRSGNTPPSSFSNKRAIFPELRCLVLKDCYIEEVRYICQSSLVDNITCLAFHGEWNHEVTEFFEQVAKSFPNLVELSLVDFPIIRETFPGLVSLRVLPLCKVFIPNCGRLDLHPNTAWGFLKHWSSLNELDLCSYEASFDDLQGILPFLPELSVLRLCITMSVPEEISDADLAQALALQLGTTYRPLKLISSRDEPQISCELSELDEVARYLLSMRPHISYWSSSDMERPWRYRRYKWLEYLNAQLQAPPDIRRGRQNKWESFEGILG